MAVQSPENPLVAELFWVGARHPYAEFSIFLGNARPFTARARALGDSGQCYAAELNARRSSSWMFLERQRSLCLHYFEHLYSRLPNYASYNRHPAAKPRMRNMKDLAARFDALEECR